MKGLGDLMKQAQAMQGQLAKMQEELAGMSVTGAAGGGMVEVTINGKQEMQRVRIDPSVVDPQEIEMLEDLVVAAFNDAQRKLQGITKERMAEMAGGLNIPGLNLPF